jgi:hypothetical protein
VIIEDSDRVRTWLANPTWTLKAVPDNLSTPPKRRFKPGTLHRIVGNSSLLWLSKAASAVATPWLRSASPWALGKHPKPEPQSFGWGAASMTLRKRNKLIVAISKGVLVAQSAVDGGAMNAYRAAVEQGKPVATFEGDSSPDTTGNALIATKPTANGAVFSFRDAESAFSLWLAKVFS